MVLATHPVKRVEAREPLPPDQWPMTIPAVAQVMAEGLDLAPGVTFLVGENGSGKSTLVEGIADAAGLPIEGGDRQFDARTWESESPLGRHLKLERGFHANDGFFLRAETMHGWLTRMAALGSARGDLHRLSHGESFLEMAMRFMRRPGFYVLDEPESALSFSSTLALLGHFDDIVRTCDAQILCATHSPVLCALPGAVILEVSERGLEEVAWSDLDLVRVHKLFFDDPMRQLRHVIG